MANTIVNLPLPVANGAGAAVAVSTMGATKTVIVTGSFPGCSLIIEASVDGGTVFAPVVLFQDGADDEVVGVVADHLRVRVTGRKSAVPFSATVDVGGPTDTPLFADLPMPVLNGPGTSVDISTFADFLTMIAGGSFQGAAIVIEISDDNTDFAPLSSFAGRGGLRSRVVTANWIRVNVSGRKSAVPFTGSVSIGAGNLTSGGGGSGTGVDVQLDGADVTNPADTLNFHSPGVLVTDGGGGVAEIWATLIPAVAIVSPDGGDVVDLVAGKVNQIDTDSAVIAIQAHFPPANSVPDGTPLVIKQVSTIFEDGHDGGPLLLRPDDTDTLDHIAGDFGQSFDIVGQSQLWVTDGVANWNLVSDWTPFSNVGEPQAYIYVADGSELAAGFDVDFPVAMFTTNYIVEVTLGAHTFFIQPSVIQRFTDHFVMATSAAPEAGDEFHIFVTPITGSLE